MFKFQITNSKSQIISKFKILMTKTFGIWCLVLGICLIFGAWCLVIPVRGQSPTPEPTPTVDPAIQQKVEERMQRVLTARAGKKRAFVGKISEITITNTTLVLDTHKGKKQAKTGEETEIVGLEKKEIEFEDLEIGSFAIAMGYLEETDILDARRIVTIKKPKIPARLVAFGIVDDKSSVEGEKILKVKHPKKGTIYEVEAISRTKITKKIEGEMERIGFDEIAKDDRLVAIGTPAEENNFLTAKVIHVIPGRAVGLPSPSPEPSPSP